MGLGGLDQHHESDNAPCMKRRRCGGDPSLNAIHRSYVWMARAHEQEAHPAVYKLFSTCEPAPQWLSRAIAMEASLSSSSLLSLTCPKTHGRGNRLESDTTLHFPLRKNYKYLVKNAGRRRIGSTRIAAINDVQTVLDPAPVEVTWQIVVGAIAGVAPFVVAGVEFSKRIIAQQRCEECRGSGLVRREKEYFRCPECGGFLPWQSWKRFFSG